MNARIAPSVNVWAPWNLVVGEEAAIAHHVDCYSVDRLCIGNHATVSQYSMLCTASHDITSPHMDLISDPVTIENGAWICAGAFVGPGVTVSEGAVLGARSVATRDIDPWTVHAGNPANFIKKRLIKNNRTECQASSQQNKPESIATDPESHGRDRRVA